MKRKRTAILVSVAILLFVAALIYFDAKVLKELRQPAQGKAEILEPEETTERPSEPADITDVDGAQESSENETDPDAGEILIRNEKISVEGNTPEYELEARLCETTDGRVFIRLEYYLDGARIVNDLDEGELPELSELFPIDGSAESAATGYIADQVLLNPVHSQLYIRLQDVPEADFNQNSLYMAGLCDMSIKKLFSYPGKYGRMALNGEGSLLAYSFADPPHLSVYQEDYLLEVFDCDSMDYLIKGSRDKKGEVIGSISTPDSIRDYEFMAWQSAGVLKLRQSIQPVGDKGFARTWSEVLYDIDRNQILNPDGSVYKPAVAQETNGGVETEVTDHGMVTDPDIDPASGCPQANDGEEATKVLENFYCYLADEDSYLKAMELLDDDFKLKLFILKQFGVEEIKKEDISEENASLYGSLLKAARLDSVKSSDIEGDTCHILYFQLMDFGGESQVKQILLAQLKKDGETWRIILIEEKDQ